MYKKKPMVQKWVISTFVIGVAICLASCVTKDIASTTIEPEPGNGGLESIPTQKTAEVASSPTPRPSSRLSPTPSKLDAQSPTLSPAQPKEPLQPLERVSGEIEHYEHIRGITMKNLLVGWAVSDKHLFRSEDGGSTWLDVSPPEIGPGGQTEGITANFLDHDHAYVVYDEYFLDKYPWKTVEIWRTTDGGDTWQTSEPLDITGMDKSVVTSLTFTDTSYGWLLVEGGYVEHPYQSIRYYLFRTSDGGRTWTRIHDFWPGEDVALESWEWPEMAFFNSEIGLASFDSYVEGDGIENSPVLFWTNNGGENWAQIDLVAPKWDPLYSDVLPENVHCLTRHPQIFSQSNAVVVGECFVLDSDKTAIMLYRTEDGGDTWTSIPLPAKGDAAWSIEFINEYHGWLFGPSTYLTRDGGRSWDIVNRLGWRWGNFTFINEDIGWAMAFGGDFWTQPKDPFVQTLDGGKTWEIMEYEIE
jgi:photosystem II stability/assembly factor-like uncharacterized protein